MKVLPYSYSSLTSFEKCARKHFRIKVSKQVKDLEYKAAADGTDVHTQAENYINESTLFEGKYAKKIMSIVDAMRNPDAPVQSEVKLAVTRDLKPCEFFAPDCHARGILDVFQIIGDTAYIKDWKTGRSDTFSLQLNHNSMLVFATYPEVRKVETEYVWLKEGFSTKRTHYRDFLDADWQKFEKRVIKLEKALETNNWPAQPGFLCKSYCADVECEHNGKK